MAKGNTTAQKVGRMSRPTTNIPEAMVYGGRATPWHGFGFEISKDQTVFDIAPKAGLDFEVAVEPIGYGFPKVLKEDGSVEGWELNSVPQYTTVERRALYRTDDGTLFDMPGKGYHPIQNRDMLDMFDHYVREGDMRIETAGTFDHGRRNWLLVDMDMEEQVKQGKKSIDGDIIQGKLLCYFPHIYGEGAWFKTTSISVVCINTLDAAAHEKGGVFRMWHNVEWNESRKKEAKLNLELSRDNFRRLVEEANLLAEAKLDLEAAKFVAVAVVGDKDRKFADQGKSVRRVIDLYSGEGRGMGLPSREGTAWGLLNAFTEFTDWEYGSAKTSQESRLARAWLGQGEVVKRKARKMIMDVVTGKIKPAEALEVA